LIISDPELKTVCQKTRYLNSVLHKHTDSCLKYFYVYNKPPKTEEAEEEKQEVVEG
jgi:hypothetical protein